MVELSEHCVWEVWSDDDHVAVPDTVGDGTPCVDRLGGFVIAHPHHVGVDQLARAVHSVADDQRARTTSLDCEGDVSRCVSGRGDRRDTGHGFGAILELSAR